MSEVENLKLKQMLDSQVKRSVMLRRFLRAALKERKLNERRARVAEDERDMAVQRQQEREDYLVGELIKCEEACLYEDAVTSPGYHHQASTADLAGIMAARNGTED